MSEESPARGVRAELLERRAQRRAALDEVADLEREHRRVRLDELAARWGAADGTGPVPGQHAFEAAGTRGDDVAAERALEVARRSVEARELAHSDPGATAGSSRRVLRSSGAARRDEPAVAPSRPALRVLLDDLQAAGRPIPVLLPDERTLLEGRAETDPGGFDRALADVRARARTEAARLRLLFDLEHLTPHLPGGLVDELSAAAAAVESGGDPSARFRDIRQRMLDGLASHRKA